MRILHVMLSVLVCCLSGFNSNARAGDWPQFRGPTGQGISTATDVPTQWSPTKNVTWKTPIPGKGWSSPIVYQGRIYLTTAVKPPGATGNERSLRALCLDAQTGKTLWNIEVFQQPDSELASIHRKNSHASSTPIAEGKYVYLHFGTQGTACLTLDGKTVWKTRKLKYDPRHGNGNSPVIVDDLLIINCDGYDVQYIVALDKTTGNIRWKKDRPDVGTEKGFSFATPLVIETGGNKQVISPASDQVVAYEPSTGNSIWTLRYDGFSVIPRPVYAHGMAFFSTGYMRPKLLAVETGGKGDVTDSHLKWSIARGAPNTPSPLVVGRELYFVSDKGVASCVDARTGTTHWRRRLGGNFSASPLYADGNIYFQSEDGVTTVVKAGKTFQEVAKNALEERTFASIAVADQALFIRTETQLYRIEK